MVMQQLLLLGLAVGGLSEATPWEDGLLDDPGLIQVEKNMLSHVVTPDVAAPLVHQGGDASLHSLDAMESLVSRLAAGAPTALPHKSATAPPVTAPQGRRSRMDINMMSTAPAVTALPEFDMLVNAAEARMSGRNGNEQSFETLRAAAVLRSRGAQKHGDRILFVLRSAPKYYHSRLKDVLETYLTSVPTELILVVSNTAATLHVPGSLGPRDIEVQATDQQDPRVGLAACEDNHWHGMTCIEGRALYYAWQRRGSFDWVFVLDDDVYVLYDNLKERLSQLDMRLPHIHTIPGCAPEAGCASHGGGICGGGGYAISRHNLERTIEGSLHGNANAKPALHEWMRQWFVVGASVKADTGEYWSDITAGCAASTYGGIDTVMLPGLHGFTVNRADLQSQLDHEKPLSYHYIGREEMPQMREMHQLVTGDVPLQWLQDTAR